MRSNPCYPCRADPPEKALLWRNDVSPQCARARSFGWVIASGPLVFEQHPLLHASQLFNPSFTRLIPSRFQVNLYISCVD